jgi:carbamate kinase
MSRRADRWVVAIGGNALADPHDIWDLARQQERADAIAPALADLLAAGNRLAIVHGNGPQVGGRLIQNESARDEVPASPLSVCVAETQAQIGHHLGLALVNELHQREIAIPVVSLITHVLVDVESADFDKPEKPIGPVYPAEEARHHEREQGWQTAEVPGGRRRVVPSPRALRLIEQEAIDSLLEAGVCVIAGGGGGVPVAPAGNGRLLAVDAVIDKDYTAERLATETAAACLIILTDVPGVALHFGNPAQTYLSELSAAEASPLLESGELPRGSMGPKVEACLAFLANGGLEARIASIAEARSAFAGQSGTRLSLA